MTTSTDAATAVELLGVEELALMTTFAKHFSEFLGVTVRDALRQAGVADEHAAVGQRAAVNAGARFADQLQAAWASGRSAAS